MCGSGRKLHQFLIWVVDRCEWFDWYIGCFIPRKRTQQVDPRAGSDIPVKKNISCLPRNLVVAVADLRGKCDESRLVTFYTVWWMRLERDSSCNTGIWQVRISKIFRRLTLVWAWKNSQHGVFCAMDSRPVLDNENCCWNVSCEGAVCSPTIYLNHVKGKVFPLQAWCGSEGG